MTVNFSYCRRFTDAEWADSVNQPDFVAFKQTLDQLKAEFPQVTGTVYAYRVTGDGADQALKMTGAAAQLPQVLFSFPGAGDSEIYIAKLVQSQITLANLRTMLKTVVQLKPMADIEGHFYDPALNFSALGWNPTEAPTSSGFSFLHLNPYDQSLGVDRFGQQLSGLVGTALKLLPFAVGILLFNKLTEKR